MIIKKMIASLALLQRIKQWLPTYIRDFMSLLNFSLVYRNWGQSYKADFGINYVKNGFNKLNFTLNYINFDVMYAKKVL